MWSYLRPTASPFIVPKAQVWHRSDAAFAPPGSDGGIVAVADAGVIAASIVMPIAAACMEITRLPRVMWS